MYKKSKMSLINAITPLNEKEEKIKFLSSRRETPNFKYPILNFNPDKEIRKLKNKNPSGLFEEQRRNKIKEKILFNKAKKFVNKPEFLNVSINIYGSPSVELVDEALKNLKNFNFEREKKYFPYGVLIDKICFRLKKYRLYNWKVYESKNNIFSIVPSCNIIFVPKKNYGENEIKKIFLHEIDTHVLRTCNGLKQRVYSNELFGRGTAKYEETEEGLAIYLQYLNNHLDNLSLSKISASVVAINNMIRGESFRDTYEMFRDLGFDSDFAWDRTLRAYRGGGFTKDYIYLSGFKKVKSFHFEGNNLKDLYIGKISIDDLEWVKPLIERGILKNPTYLPSCKLLLN